MRPVGCLSERSRSTNRTLLRPRRRRAQRKLNPEGPERRWHPQQRRKEALRRRRRSDLWRPKLNFLILHAFLNVVDRTSPSSQGYMPLGEHLNGHVRATSGNHHDARQNVMLRTEVEHLLRLRHAAPSRRRRYRMVRHDSTIHPTPAL
eukprot:scaffold3504_cov240-Pinguiococcus_pyrenoidosus.AAC.38